MNSVTLYPRELAPDQAVVPVTPMGASGRQTGAPMEWKRACPTLVPVGETTASGGSVGPPWGYGKAWYTMTDDDPGKTGTPDLTPREAMKDAKKRHSAAIYRLRQKNDPASFEAFQQAEVDYIAAPERWAISINPNMKEIFEQSRNKVPPQKKLS